MSDHDHVQTYPTPTGLKLYTFSPTSFNHAERRLALELDLGADGRVRIGVTDAAYKPLAADLEAEGVYSHPLQRTVTAASDGLTFLMAVKDMLVNSSYWQAEWRSETAHNNEALRSNG